MSLESLAPNHRREIPWKWHPQFNFFNLVLSHTLIPGVWVGVTFGCVFNLSRGVCKTSLDRAFCRLVPLRSWPCCGSGRWQPKVSPNLYHPVILQCCHSVCKCYSHTLHIKLENIFKSVLLLTLPDTLSFFKQQQNRRERWEQSHVAVRKVSRRSVSKERWVETLVVADSKMVEYHGSDHVESYILTIMNMVRMVFPFFR